ncbi:MAG: WD40/YVTN/BNR-like repeat-containing protein, partial [Planctomycetota bacterium]
WRGPSEVWENGGIRNHHWEEVGFGDGFDTQPDPDDAMAGYSMSQEGFIKRYDLRTGERRDVRPDAPDGVTLRFNWNAGLALDPFDSAGLYYGSQFVHKSNDRGRTWQIISPDLTSNNVDWQQQAASGGLTLDVTGAENYTTVLTIAPSPLQEEVIWAGTDDGRVHITRDGGKNWTRVDEKIPGLPAGAWCPHIEASKFDAATAFAVFDDHRRSNWTPYVYRSDDYGQTWKPLAGSDIHGYALAIEQDPVDPNLLFLGTEFGLYFSQNGGGNWQAFKHGVPTASCMDLVVHPREHDLVIGTHGRAAFIIDDISPLRRLNAELIAKDMALLPMQPAQQYRVKQTGASRFPGKTEWRGENPAYGANFYLWLSSGDLPHPNSKIETAESDRPMIDEASAGGDAQEAGEEEAKPKVKIRILDAAGEQVCEFEEEVKRGLNRLNWSLASASLERPKDAGNQGRRGGGRGPSGPQVLPGVYQVEVSMGEQSATGEVKVLADPRTPISREDRIAKWEALERGRQLNDELVAAIDALRSANKDIEHVLEKQGEVEDEAQRKQLVEAGKACQKKIEELEKKLWTPPGGKGITARTHALSKVGYISGSLASSWDAPTSTQLTYLRQAEEIVRTFLNEVESLMQTEVVVFREKFQSLGIGLLSNAVGK